MFFFIVFIIGLQPYLRLDTLRMARDTLIKHEEVVMIYEENGLVIANCNTLITHPKSKTVAQLLLFILLKNGLPIQIVVKLVMLNKPMTTRKEKNM